jgi:signal transduction histidine kinase
VAHDAQIDLLADLDASLPKVEFDHKLIYNALYNLTNNAIPETPEGGRVTLRTRALIDQESSFLVEVSDTGRGMLPEVRDRLFTDETVSTKPGGTGLGTRIVADVVRRHKGHIAVQSEPGAGTTFTLLLPVSQEK